MKTTHTYLDLETAFTRLDTPEALSERWHVAQILDAGEKSYRDIQAETGVSTTTIGRVARFLRDEPHGGYRAIWPKTALRCSRNAVYAFLFAAAACWLG